MEQNLIKKEDNILFLLKKIQYGTNFVFFENDEDKQMAGKFIDVQNLIFKSNVVEMKPGFDNELIDKEWIQKPVEGRFDIVWKLRDESPVPLTYNDLCIDHNASVCHEFEKEVEFTLNPLLFKYAKKKAAQMGIKFQPGADKQRFVFVKRNTSVSKRLLQAYQNQQSSVSFDISEISPATLRVYCSNFSSTTGQKIKMQIEGNTLTVLLKESSKEDIARYELGKLCERFINEMGVSATQDVFNDIYATKLTLQTQAVPKPTQTISNASDASSTETDADDF